MHLRSIKRPDRLWNVSHTIAGLAFLIALHGGCPGQPCAALAEDAGANAKSAAYYKDIAQAQSDLDAGHIAEARRRLEATDKSLRGFEFEYLHTRAERATEEGQPAPDLIQKVAKPKVESRYGILNDVTGQLTYICRDGSLHIYELKSRDAEPKVVKHAQGAAIWSGTFSRDGKLFFSGHQNGDVLVWDAATWELRHTVALGNEWPVRELVTSPDGAAFVAESKGALELWSLAGKQPQKVADVGQRYNFGEGLAFSPKGDLLATGGMFDILLHDTKTGQVIKSMRHASYTMGLEFSPDGQRIASAPRGNVNKFLAVFDIEQKALLFNAGPFGNYVAGMSFTPDGKRIAATGCEKVLRLFDAANGQIALSLKRPECGAKPCISRDGRILGWNEPEGFLYIELGKIEK